MKLPSEVDSLKCGTKLKIKIAQKNQNNLNNRPPPQTKKFELKNKERI